MRGVERVMAPLYRRPVKPSRFHRGSGTGGALRSPNARSYSGGPGDGGGRRRLKHGEPRRLKIASRDQSIEPSRWNREIATHINHPGTVYLPLGHSIGASYAFDAACCAASIKWCNMIPTRPSTNALARMSTEVDVLGINSSTRASNTTLFFW